MYRGHRRHGYWISLVKLISHIAGTAVMFTAILLAAWALSWLVHSLDQTHKFPEEVYVVVTRIELWILYVDVGISGVVLVLGAWKFISELWENMQ